MADKENVVSQEMRDTKPPGEDKMNKKKASKHKIKQRQS